jgi:RNA polymerase sigma-70 factor (ECF subfamily)
MSADEAAFEACWREDMPRIMRYASRHVGLEDAREVAAETFATAWRRWHDVPHPPLPWLLVTARNVISNQTRTSIRQRRLVDRMRMLGDIAAHATDVDPGEREDALRTLASLSVTDREALLLVAWDGLDPASAADVLNISLTAFRQRLSRARRAVAGVADSSTLSILTWENS